MELVSACALKVAKIVWRPGHGGFAFTVVCKATFDLQPERSPLAEQQEPVLEADAYAESGSLLQSSELVPFKKRPELLVTGHAHAPEGSPVRSLAVRVAIGEIDKTIQVVGDRSFGPDGRLGEPERFVKMPLTWERAAGGPGTINPVGIPVGASAKPDAFGCVPAPNLLPAGLKLVSRADAVLPVGLGPLSPRWPSRAASLPPYTAGWDPRRWHERLLPVDLDLSYFNAAPPDQQRSAAFGEEALQLKNLHPRVVFLSTRLASVTPAATVDHGFGPTPLQLRCDTLLIDADRGLAMLVWRGHVLLDQPDRPGRVVVTGPLPAPPPPLVWPVTSPEAEITLALGTTLGSLPALPFAEDDGPLSRTSLLPAPAEVEEAAPETKRAAPARLGAVSELSAGPSPVGTLAFGFVLSGATPLPFASTPAESAPRRDAPPPSNDAALPFRSSLPKDGEETPPALLRPDQIEAPPSPRVIAPIHAAPLLIDETLRPDAPPRELPAPPPLLGAIAIAPEPRFEEQDTVPPPAAEGPPPIEPAAVEQEAELPFEAYPPGRCGALAARLSCDEGRAADILRAEALDAPKWKRVHEHWLDRIRAEAARSRTALLVDYDGGYVKAIEDERGPITIEDYARFAEAAERNAVAEPLAERGLPEEAWPHLHRVWIRRMVKDLQVSKQVRAAIDALRAG